jgi:hypothetical protein
MPIAEAVVVCPPKWIQSNPDTASTNAYQSAGTDKDRDLASRQYAEFVRELRGAGIDVLELEPPEDAPDAVFPNNWFSTHADGTLAFYPMLAESRRRERQPEALRRLLASFNIVRELDYTGYEPDRFLEGTGSIVFDPVGRTAYAALSPRTDVEVLDRVCEDLGCNPFVFEASDAEMPVYHTNVVMGVGRDFAVVCLEAVTDPTPLQAHLEVAGKDVVEINREQMRSFCGNVIELAGLVLMSDQAFRAFEPEQLEVLSRDRRIIHPDISAIEKMGGGSARCMVAEVLLPPTK